MRSKAQVKSSLDDIPGVGPSRRRALMKHFRSIEDMRNASVQEIAEVPGIPTNVAIKIKEYLDKK